MLTVSLKNIESPKPNNPKLILQKLILQMITVRNTKGR